MKGGAGEGYMGGGDTDRRDRRKGRDKADRQTERDFGGKGKTEDTEGSGLAEFANWGCV